MSDAEPSATVEELPADFSPGLRVVRKRRRALWYIILLYIPAIMVTLHYTSAFGKVMRVFWVWFVLMFALMMRAALVRCPRCGNYFHMNGMSLLFLRKCLHCQLHVTADWKK